MSVFIYPVSKYGPCMLYLLTRASFFALFVFSLQTSNFGPRVYKYRTMKIEKLTTLAFSMYSNKGAYALLLGSGISRSAQIPSGWEVEENLIQKLGASQGITENRDWHQWYKEKISATCIILLSS